MADIKKQIINKFNEAHNVAVFTHVRPDADAIGSCSALKMVLESQGKHVDLYCDSEISDRYNFIKFSDAFNKPTCTEYDLTVNLDCNGINRIGQYGDLFLSSHNTINIDHHISCEPYADLNLINNVSSTGEILFDLFAEMGVELNIDIANSLYSAIASDTGCFMHSNTTAHTHEVASALFNTNFDFQRANYFLFKRKTLEQIRLQKTALNNIKLFYGGKLAIMSLTLNDYMRCHVNENDNLGLVDQCVNIDGVDVGILISEIKPNLYACSFRSKGVVDVSALAEKFGGGGHKNASGCNIFGTLHTVVAKLCRVCRKSVCRDL